MKKLTGNTATLALSNVWSLSIKVNDSGDGVYYQFNGTNDNNIYEAEIEYIEDTENRTGYAEEEILQAAFRNEVDNRYYFIGEFCRDNI